jgi:hypothetical protein
MDRNQNLNRAFRAYLATNGADAEQPFPDRSGEVRLNGLGYVVLRSERRTLAVYRIKQNGALRRMKRWPITLGRASAPSTALSIHNQSNNKGASLHD